MIVTTRDLPGGGLNFGPGNGAGGTHVQNPPVPRGSMDESGAFSTNKYRLNPSSLPKTSSKVPSEESGLMQVQVQVSVLTIDTTASSPVLGAVFLASH